MITRHRLAGMLALALSGGTVAVAAPAASANALNLSATLHEPLRGSCFIVNTQLCGTGDVVGLGQVTDQILFGGACGGNCDLRTLTFADGSTLVLHETANDCTIPGASYREPDNAHGFPFSCTLADTVDGADSTGRFAGATGDLSGEVNAAGQMATIKLAGPVTLAQ